MLLTHDARGVFPIAPTPFHADGRIDEASVDRLTDFYLGIGATGITVLGQLGEAPKLEHAEGVALAHSPRAAAYSISRPRTWRPRSHWRVMAAESHASMSRLPSWSSAAAQGVMWRL